MGPDTLRRALLASSEEVGKHDDDLATCQDVRLVCKITAWMSVIQQRNSILLPFARGTQITLLRGVSEHFNA